MLAITSTQRRELRARAHALHPVVAIGHGGLTPSVLHEIDVALGAHELVKVRVHSDDREARGAHLAAICDALAAAPVQHLGKMLILWRPVPKKEPLAVSRKPQEKPGRRRRDERGAAAAPQRARTGEPAFGPRAQKHRRGAARHAPDGGGRGGAKRKRKEVVEPAVPSTSASRGKKYVGGKPAMPGTRRDDSRRRAKPSAARPSPLARPPASSPTASERAPAIRERRTFTSSARPIVAKGRRPAGSSARKTATPPRPPSSSARKTATPPGPPSFSARKPAKQPRPPSSSARKPAAKGRRGAEPSSRPPSTGAPAMVRRRRRPTGGG